VAPSTQPPQPSEALGHFDCIAGFSDWEHGWSQAEKDWCCEKVGRGCPSYTLLPFDCNAGYANWRHGWSDKKKEWCCTNAGVGCEAHKPFDCLADLANWEARWTADKKEWCCIHESRGCPKNGGCTTAAPTPNQAIKPLMTCDLNCYDHGAETVALAGSMGTGDHAVVKGVTRQACRDLCFSHADCESILYSEESSQCIGKKNIHTSMCQRGDAYGLEVLRQMPFGTCGLFGDPHVLTFDGQHGKALRAYKPGVYWLVKSSELSIQARFGYTEQFPRAASVVGVALGGSLIRDHTLVIVYVGPEKGTRGFKAFWDDKEILEHFPSRFQSPDGIISARHDAMDPSEYHKDARHTIGGHEGALPSYLLKLQPDMQLYLLLGEDSCNVVLEMRKLSGGQDGYCGNFNCLAEDDTRLHEPVTTGETLFSSGPTAPPSQLEPSGPLPHLADCAPERKSEAKRVCGNLTGDIRKECIFDCCASSEPGCRSIARADTALKELVTTVEQARRSRSVASKSVMPLLTCPLNCFGEGGRTVKLAGRSFSGDGAVQEVSLQECRELCNAEESCEAIVYSDHATPSRCYGKADVNTSKCQPGAGYITEAIGHMPWGVCGLFGDPHIFTFDTPLGPTVDKFEAGEYWLIKGAGLRVQGRFGYTERFPHEASSVGIAVTGSLVKDHILAVAYVGPGKGAEGFKVYWDGLEILQHFPSQFTSGDGTLHAQHKNMTPSAHHREARHTIGGTEGDLPSYFFVLPDVTVYILIGPDSCNMVIRAKKLPGGQDGYCGNFNCDAEDDVAEALQSRRVADKVGQSLSLFPEKLAAPSVQLRPHGGRPGLEDCSEDRKKRYRALCRKHGDGSHSEMAQAVEDACVVDCCSSSDSCEKIAVADMPMGELEQKFFSGFGIGSGSIGRVVTMGVFVAVAGAACSVVVRAVQRRRTSRRVAVGPAARFDIAEAPPRASRSGSRAVFDYYSLPSADDGGAASDAEEQERLLAA